MVNGMHLLRTARFSAGPTEVQLRMVGRLLKRGARP